MSATGRGSEYRDGACYFTPHALAYWLVERVPELATPQLVLEPHVGGGAFLEAIARRELATRTYHRVAAMDIDPHSAGIALAQADGAIAVMGDFLSSTPPFAPTLVLGNPPYATPQPPISCPSCAGSGRVVHGGCRKCRGSGSYTPKAIPAAERHVRRALQVLAPGGHAYFLLRLAMLEAGDRLQFWREFPARDILVLSRRPRFFGGSSDATAYGWFHWQAGYSGATTISVGDNP